MLYEVITVRVGVVLSGSVVVVMADRLMRSELLQPNLVVMVQAAFVVVDEHRRRAVHGVDQAQPRITSYNVCYTKLLRRLFLCFDLFNKGQEHMDSFCHFLLRKTINTCCYQHEY